MLSAAETERLHSAGTALKELVDRFVFVGGAVTGILITDPGAPPVRETDDVDVIVQGNRRGYYLVEARLRELGFKHDHTGNSPLCRWRSGSLVLDVMPDDSAILGFSNRWYADAFATAEEVPVGSLRLRVIGAVWFLATKVEAFDGRGHGDYQASHDMEDIIAVVDGRPTIADEIQVAPAPVRTYLAARISKWLDDSDFTIALAGHVAGDLERADFVLHRLTQISKL